MIRYATRSGTIDVPATKMDWGAEAQTHRARRARRFCRLYRLNPSRPHTAPEVRVDVRTFLRPVEEIAYVTREESELLRYALLASSEPIHEGELER